MNPSEALALVYFVPILFWFAVIGLLFRIWWSRRLEDSLAYLVFLRERKVLFVSLILGLAALHVTNSLVKMFNGFGWVSDYDALGIGMVVAVAGSVIVFLFGWTILRVPASGPDHPLTVDGPAHFLYAAGVVDRVEHDADRGPAP